MVKLLHALLKGKVAIVVRKVINAKLPGCLAWLTGYVAILVGAGVTVVIQSSSVFTSTLTPLVGVGLIKLERMYPLTLGANIGTTATGILAAMATSQEDLSRALQLALCHLIFNVSGILIWYPVPFLRRVPILMAKGLGNTTAEYGWFAIVYLIITFFLIPALVFGLSLAGWKVLLTVGAPLLLLLITIIVINISQSKCPGCLPIHMRSWGWLPLWLHSLQPLDGIIKRACGWCMCCHKLKQNNHTGMFDIEMNETYLKCNAGKVNPAFQYK